MSGFKQIKSSGAFVLKKMRNSHIIKGNKLGGNTMTFDNKTLKGKTAVLAVTGSIAAYKIVNLARMLKKLGANVLVLMTKNATEFITPLTFEQLTGNKCLIDTFDRNYQYNVEHVALAKQADVVLVAPASANVIGKIANGIADDMLTTTVMACPCKKIISPAMNHNMYHNPIVQDNIEKLARFGYEIIPPETGMLANGDSGDGRMPDERLLLEYILKEIACEKDLAGKKVLVTAGATREAIDPVRFITNHSTGKMGFALAHAAMLRGPDVTVVAGHTAAEGIQTNTHGRTDDLLGSWVADTAAMGQDRAILVQVALLDGNLVIFVLTKTRVEAIHSGRVIAHPLAFHIVADLSNVRHAILVNFDLIPLAGNIHDVFNFEIHAIENYFVHLLFLLCLSFIL